MSETKQITFQGQEYTVPSFVSWVGINRDGFIWGYQYEPFETHHWHSTTGYSANCGQECVIYSPERTPRLERV